MDVREAIPADAAALVSLFDDLDHPATAEQLHRRLSRLHADPTYAAWVAYDDRALVGFAAGHLLYPMEDDAPAAQFIALVTARELQSRGIGAQLAQAFEHWGISHHACRAIVTSSHYRHQAHTFYVRRGYASTGVRLVKPLG